MFWIVLLFVIGALLVNFYPSIAESLKLDSDYYKNRDKFQ